MTESDVIEPIRIDADLWSHRDLLERVVQRCFHIIEEIHDVEIGWEVTLSNQQDSAEAALNALNRHLRGLSWIAILQEGNPYDLIILPEPPRGIGLSNVQTSAIWTVFTIFLTLAGAAWLQLQDSELKLTDIDLLVDAFCWFALPISLVMFIGSDLRRRIGLRSGVDLGYHIPLAVPFLMTPGSPIWPFGLIGFMSQRRMDLVAFRDRKSLAAMTLITPLTLIVSGFAFTLMGYWLTSNTSPHFGSTPTMVNPSLFPEFILSLVFTSEEISLRSAWLHPLGLAGIALATMGWILLLPLPGFPGDRLLSALLNPGEMGGGGTQTWLFVGILAAGIYVLLNGGYWPWLVLIGLGVWRRFSPESSATPFVLNESKGFDESSKNQFGIVMVALLLLGFPGLMPVGNLENWDAGLDTTEWPTEVYFSADEDVQITFPLLTKGVMLMDVEFQFRWLGAIEHGQIADGCGHPWVSCTFNGIGPISEQSLEVKWPSPTLGQIGGPSALQIIWFEDGLSRIHEVNLTPDVTPMPIEIAWNWDGDSETPQYCTNVTLDVERAGNITIDPNHVYAPLFSFDGTQRLAIPAGDEMEVCITGLFGSHRLTYIDGSLAPGLIVTMDDGTTLRWSLPVQGMSPERASGVWPATASGWGQSGWKYIALLEEDAPIICPMDRVSTSVPTDENGSWILNLSDIPLAPLPENRENGTIILPDSGRIIVCGENQKSWYAELVPANGTLNHAGGGGWTYVIPDWVNVGDQPIDVKIETAAFGVTAEWDISDFTLEPGQQAPAISGTPTGNPDILQLFWFEPTEDLWTLHLVAHCIATEGCGGGDD